MKNNKIRKPGMRMQLRMRQGATMSLRMRLVLIAVSSSLLVMLAMMPIITGDLILSEGAFAFSNYFSKKDVKENDNPDLTQPDNNSRRTRNKKNNNGNNSAQRVGYVDMTNTGVFYISAGTIVGDEGGFIVSASGNSENNGAGRLFDLA